MEAGLRIAYRPLAFEPNLDHVMSLYGWGAANHGQLTEKAEEFHSPVALDLKLPSKIELLRGGGSHTLLYCDKQLYGFGSNDEHQLGLESVKSSHNLIPISLPANGSVLEIASGWSHNVLTCKEIQQNTTLKNEQQAFLVGFGSNEFGQLSSDLPAFHSPSIVNFPLNVAIKHVSCGMRHTCAVSEDGEAYFWGENKFAQCGSYPSQSIRNPLKLNLNYHVTMVSLGSRHSILVTRCNKLFSVGENRFGQAGLDPTKTEHLPSGSEKSKSKKLSNILSIPTEIELPDKEGTVVKVGSGWNHNLTLISRNTSLGNHLVLYSFGRNNYGQLGIGSISPFEWQMNVVKLPLEVQVVDFCCGAEHNLVLDDSGNVWSFGWNEHGQLGLGHTMDEPLPSQVVFTNSSPILSIACGYGYSFASHDKFEGPLE